MSKPQKGFDYTLKTSFHFYLSLSGCVKKQRIISTKLTLLAYHLHNISFLIIRQRHNFQTTQPCGVVAWNTIMME